MNLWFAPQISEHWPKKMPGRWEINLTWFSRPGIASAFTPKDGTVHECNTSADEINIRIWILYGIIVRLSTSNKRKKELSKSLTGIIYDSNSILLLLIDQKSLYSYLQYHWCPITLIVKDESIDSSNIYNNNKDGIAIWTKMIAGMIVQIHSIICLSSKVILIILLNNIKIIIYLTKEIINIKIKLIKSCKKINSSIIGELASCRPNWPQFIIYNL